MFTLHSSSIYIECAKEMGVFKRRRWSYSLLVGSFFFPLIMMFADSCLTVFCYFWPVILCCFSPWYINIYIMLSQPVITIKKWKIVDHVFLQHLANIKSRENYKKWKKVDHVFLQHLANIKSSALIFPLLLFSLCLRCLCR